MQVIPALDLLDNDAVRLEKGDFNKVLFRQPVEEFMGRLVATKPTLIHVVDLQGARDGNIRSEAIARCQRAAQGIPIQVSGGIRSLESAREALDAGASRVIVGTAAWEHNGDALQSFVDALGDQLLVAIDVKEGRLAVSGWLELSPLSVDEAMKRCQQAGVARLHVTAIERDGTMRGPDLALYEKVCKSDIAVVAAGGVRDQDDIDALAQLGCEAAVMGLGYLARLGISLETTVHQKNISKLAP
jgi:phosphoribosylformimino-5-aminoimidazole carboxamide ribotide isomerase